MIIQGLEFSLAKEGITGKIVGSKICRKQFYQCQLPDVDSCAAVMQAMSWFQETHCII